MNDDETIWIDKPAGTLGERTDKVSEHFGWPGTVLFHRGKPDWVRHPVSGEQRRVIDMFDLPCVCLHCGVHDVKKTLEVEGDGGPLFVSECKHCHQFVWYTLEGEKK